MMLAKSLQSAAGNAAAEANYIEDVFSTYLYTGNGSTQTITNGIDLAGEGGLVWSKQRSGTGVHYIVDSTRGIDPTWSTYYRLDTSSTAAETSSSAGITAFTQDGFGVTGSGSAINGSGQIYASWTFRKQEKFFDCVTYTGDGTNTQQVTHSLGATPGVILIKRTNTAENWCVFHRGNGTGNAWTSLSLNLTNAGSQGTPQSTVTSTYFKPADIWGASSSPVRANINGATYVAYLFAHNAGGFGESGEDNVISCGSYTGNSTSGVAITLGYEPQWVMIKRTDSTGNWTMIDTMRGFPVGSNDSAFWANTTNAELSGQAGNPTATGFYLDGSWSDVNAPGGTYIYIAIRRGPMKVPESGTSVLGLSARTGTGANATVTGGAGVTDLAIIKNYVPGSGASWVWASRLTGTGYLSSNTTSAEAAAGTTILQTSPWDVMDGVKVGTTSVMTNESSQTFMNFLIDRAPGFMDVCCYTGDGTGTRAHNHNLGVTPEMFIVKKRSTTSSWYTYHKDLSTPNDVYLAMESTGAVSASSGVWGTGPTSTNFSSVINTTGQTHVAYLFATLPGVSKVGSYTGNGGSQNIECGFAAGARFILIKRTDSTGDWWLWNSARGIVLGNDPYAPLNSDYGEITGADDVDPYSGGFAINQVSGSATINASGGTYIFLAIA